MSPIAVAVDWSREIGQLKGRLKTTWRTGDYGRFARYMEKGAEEFFVRFEIAPGARLLDVACGAGQIALLAARAGAKVTACDIATNWLAQGRSRAVAEGLSITFEEADAECLPFTNQQFDVVVSLIGAMFAPRPELVARELTRVCRPGGTIAMANWTRGGFIGQMFQTIAKYIAPSGMPSPVLWGDEPTVRDRFRQGIAGIRLAHRQYPFEYPFPPEEVVQFFRLNYGPMAVAFDSLDANAQADLRRELVRLWSTHNRAEGKGTQVLAEYLEVIATRG